MLPASWSAPFDEKYPLGQLKLGQPAVQRLQHRRLVQPAILAGHHHGGDAFAKIGVADADHGRLDHAGQRIDLGFHFLRVDVVAARDHQILAAANDMHITKRIDLAEIAGDEETVGAEFGGGLLRHAPVALL